MKTAYKFRMYPNRQQNARLELTLDTCRHLYNQALADRKNAYEIEDVPQAELKTAIGVDVGLKNLVALSTGETVEYPHYYVQAEEKLAAAQRNLSEKKNGSANRRKAKAKVAKLHQKIQNHREEFMHQVSRKLVDSADIIVSHLRLARFYDSQALRK